MEEVERLLLERDRRDSSRPVAPLTKPAGAIEIDTSQMDIAAMTAKLLACVEALR